jgi:hypothetical protein
MIEVSFGVGFAAPDFTRSSTNLTCSSNSLDSPDRSANSSSGINLACDTRLSSSNTALSARQA